MGKNAKSSDHTFDVEQIQSQRKEQRRLYDYAIKSGYPEIRGAVVITIDAVVDWIERKGETVSVLMPREELIDIRLPFSKTMLEYEVPEDGIFGIYIVTVDDLHYSVKLFEWSRKFNRGVAVGDCVVELTPEGGYKDNTMVFTYDTRSPFSREDVEKIYRVGLFAGLLAIQSMNSQCVEFIDHEQHIVPRLLKRRGTKPVTFKELLLKPTHVQHENNNAKPYQGIMPEHARRGHPATYTEDAPLFGKFVGTFWRKPTVVGERKNGIVVKDYKVSAPDENL